MLKDAAVAELLFQTWLVCPRERCEVLW